MSETAESTPLDVVMSGCGLRLAASARAAACTFGNGDSAAAVGSPAYNAPARAQLVSVSE